jgi:DNA-binding NarL/FixJ family response regulator
MHPTTTRHCHPSGRTRVFLLEAHEVARRGMRDLLGSDQCIEVVGEAATAAEARVRLPVVHPDVAVIDTRLPDGDGAALCRELREADPGLACLLLTSASDEEAVFGALVAGAGGYVSKHVSGAELLDAVHTLARGESMLGRGVTLQVLERIRERVHAQDPLAVLTQQERRILELIGEGRTNREIGGHLHLAEQTVKNYVTSLLSKLGLARRTQAAVLITRLKDAREQ